MKIKTSKDLKANKEIRSMNEALRDIRDKVSLEIKDLTYEELMQYMSNQKTLHPKANWKNTRVNK